MLGRKLLHSINCPLSTMIVNGVIGVDVVLRRAAMWGSDDVVSASTIHEDSYRLAGDVTSDTYGLR